VKVDLLTGNLQTPPEAVFEGGWKGRGKEKDLDVQCEELAEILDYRTK
jgi:hypothetical protein